MPPKKSAIGVKKQLKFEQNVSSPAVAKTVDESKLSLSTINIAGLPEDEKMKIGRLVEKLFEISQKHENTLELLNKERIQHQQELQSLNHHIEEQVTIIESQIKLKDEKISTLQNKEQMLTAMVSVYQKKLKHVLEIHSVTQQTDQSFQNKLLEREKECETYQQIIQNNKNVLSTYEENARHIQKSLQQQLQQEQKKTQEQHIQIQELSQQVYLLQQDYQNLRYYYKLHSPHHELPKQLHSSSMNSLQLSTTSLPPALPTSTPASATSLQPPYYSLDSPAYLRALPPAVPTAGSRSRGAPGQEADAGSAALRRSVDSTSTLGMVSISADPIQLQPPQQQSQTSQSRRGSNQQQQQDKDQYSNYSLLYHTSFSSPDHSLLSSSTPNHSTVMDSSIGMVDDEEHSQIVDYSPMRIPSRHTKPAPDLSSSSLMNNSVDSLGSYKKPPTPRQQSSANTITNYSYTNNSINLSDADIVVGSDDFQHTTQPELADNQFAHSLVPMPSSMSQHSSSHQQQQQQQKVTKGIAITSPPAVPPTTPATKAHKAHTYSLLHLLPPSQHSQASPSVPITPSTPAVLTVSQTTTTPRARSADKEAKTPSHKKDSVEDDPYAREEDGAAMALVAVDSSSGKKRKKKKKAEDESDGEAVQQHKTTHTTTLTTTSFTSTAASSSSKHHRQETNSRSEEGKGKGRVRKDAMVEMLDELADDQEARGPNTEQPIAGRSPRSNMGNVVITSSVKKKSTLDSLVMTNHTNGHHEVTPRPKKPVASESTPPDPTAKRKLSSTSSRPPPQTPQPPHSLAVSGIPAVPRVQQTPPPTSSSPSDKAKQHEKTIVTNKQVLVKGKVMAYEPQLFDLLAEMEITGR